VKAVPEARFVLAGDGAIGEVRRRVHAEGLTEFVRTPGWVAGDAKLRQIAGCDVYVLPSYREGMPVSILEAMAAGKPVVATRVGAIPEIIEDGVNGFLVPPGDVGGLADRIAMLLGDAALRRELGRNNRAKVEESFSTPAVVETLLSVYERVRRGYSKGPTAWRA
jgi:glycosyltransferase involved in cell wall biosynthesis